MRTWLRRVRLVSVDGRDGPISKATLTAISNTRKGSGEQPRRGGDRDPVDAVGQAGRERRAVPGQGQPRQRRRPGAEQQLREGRRDRLRHGLHRRGDRLPRHQGRGRGAARQAGHRQRPTRRRSRPSREGQPREGAGTCRKAPQLDEQATRSRSEHCRAERSRASPLHPIRRSKEPIMYSTPTLATRFARSTRVLRTDVPLTEDQMRAAAPSDLRRRQAREPLRALHLHPDHRRPARPAQGGLRAVHGRAGREPHRGQDRVHQAHDPYSIASAGLWPHERWYRRRRLVRLVCAGHSFAPPATPSGRSMSWKSPTRVPARLCARRKAHCLPISGVCLVTDRAAVLGPRVFA